MKFELKQLRRDGVEGALKKAEHYRLLNEPMLAESICRDILAVVPDHAQATITLILALTDQFATEAARRSQEAEQLLQQLPDEYQRHYYGGLIAERRGIALIEGNQPGSSGRAYDWLRRAMERFEQAEKLAPEGKDDALLRWNTCARLITMHRLEAVEETRDVLPLE